MGKFVLPHEMTEELKSAFNPATAKPKFIMPHEQGQDDGPSPYDEALADEGGVKRALIGAGSRFNDLGLAVKQRVGQVGNLVGLDNNWSEEVKDRLKELKPVKKAIQKDTVAGLGRGVPDVALGLAAPSARLVPSMASGFMLNGPLEPMEDPSLGNTLWEGAKGAGAAGAGSLMVNGGLSALARGKNAYKGRFANPEWERRYRIGQENDVPLSLGDITQIPWIMKLENMSQSIPFSKRTNFMEQQAGKLSGVIDNAPAKIAGVVPSETKEDIGKTLAKSIKDRYKANRDEATKLYDDVAAKVQAIGSPPIYPAGLGGKARQLLNDYPDVFKDFMDKKAVSRLESIIDGTSAKQSKVLGPNGQPISTPATLSFDEARWLDKRLGSMIRQARQQQMAGRMDPEAFTQLTELQKALRNDITDWSKQVGSPDIANGVAGANKYFRENVVPFRNNSLTKKVLQDEHFDTDTIAPYMFRQDAPTRVSESLNFLTPEGVQAGRYYMIRQAEQAALNDALESGYSSARFLRKSDLGESGPKLFSPDELQKLDDLQELVRISRRAAGYAADPMTGNQLLKLTPYFDLKIPMFHRLFSSTSQSQGPVKFLLSDPRAYTGSNPAVGGLEAVARKGGIGAFQPDQEGE